MNTPLRNFFEEQGKPGILPSGRPAPPGGVRLLTAGEVHLFFTPRNPGGAGRRHYLGTLRPGRLLFSFVEGDGSRLLLAVPAGRAECLEVSADLFFAAAETDPLAFGKEVGRSLAPFQSARFQEEEGAGLFDPATVLALPGAAAALTGFIAKAIRFSALLEMESRIEAEADAELDAVRNDRLLREKVDRFNLILGRPTLADRPAEGDMLDPVLRKFARKYRLPFEIPPDEIGIDGGYEDRFKRCVEMNRWRVRRIRFGSELPRLDAASVLTFSKADGDPLLLNLRGRDSTVFDPASGRERRFAGRELTETVGYGYGVYESLPARRLKTVDLLRFATADSRRFLWGILLIGAVGGLMGLIPPVAMEYIAGKIIPTSNRMELNQLFLLLIFLVASQVMLGVVPKLQLISFGTSQLERFMGALFDRMFRVPVELFRKFNAGDVCSRLLAATQIQELLFQELSQQFLASIFSIFSLAVLFYYSWQLTLAGLAVTAVYAAVLLFLLKRNHRVLTEAVEAQGRQAGFLKQCFDGIVKIHGAGAEERIISRFLDDFVPGVAANYRTSRNAARIAVIGVLFPALATLCFYALAGNAQAGFLEVPAFLAFITAFAAFQQGMLGLFNGIWRLWAIGPELKRIEPFLASPLEDDAGQFSPGRLDGRVEFADVTFRYAPDRPPAVKDLSFTIEPGEFVAFVGASGAGKSTLVRLLLGFERPEKGSIFYSGRDLANLNRRAVRRQLGVILQESRVMPGSILENIISGTDCALPEAEAAIRLAALEKDIAEMPMGLFTMVDDGLISGGQQQRILIARALVGRPAIVVMDESTSALDNRTQEEIRRNIEELKTTRVVIAHRLSTVINADRIFVMDQGEIRETGTYAELMELGGIFRRLADRQKL